MVSPVSMRKQRGFAGTGRAQQRDNHARFDGQVRGGDHLHHSSGALEALFNLTCLDDCFRRSRLGLRPSRSRSRCREGRVGRSLQRKLIHELLPSLARQLVEEENAVARLHLVENRLHLARGSRVQQHVAVIVRESRNQRGREPKGQLTENGLLRLKGHPHEQISRAGGFHTLQLRDRLIWPVSG